MPKLQDATLFRNAVRQAGYNTRWGVGTVYNDIRRRSGFRRLKLDYATEVFNSSQQQQQDLERRLRQAFGDRILSMYFIPWVTYGVDAKGKPTGISLCIRLKL